MIPKISINCSYLTVKVSVIFTAIDLVRSMTHTVTSLGTSLKAEIEIYMIKSVVWSMIQLGSPLRNTSLGVASLFVCKSYAMDEVEVHCNLGKAKSN